jgi:hypothetical protein
MQNDLTRTISGLQRRAGAARGPSAYEAPNWAPASKKHESESKRRIRRKYQHFCHGVTSAIDRVPGTNEVARNTFREAYRCSVASADQS